MYIKCEQRCQIYVTRIWHAVEKKYKCPLFDFMPENIFSELMKLAATQQSKLFYR